MHKLLLFCFAAFLEKLINRHYMFCSMLNDELKSVVLGGQDPFGDIIGQDSVKKELKSAILAQRHVLIVGPPGIGKTTLAKNLAKLLPQVEVNDCSFHCDPENPVCPQCKAGKIKKRKKIKGEERFVRIQGSPDLVVEDILGDIDPVKAMQFGPLSMEAFTPGKLFKANNGILFFDELNRCPEKLQNALLQVLQERKATIGSYDVDFHVNFFFIATMNPDDSSTEKLSEVLMDRFDIIYMGYPETLEKEVRIVRKYGLDLDVPFPDQTLDLTVNFVRELRNSDKLEKFPGVRATLGLYERAQANAKLRKSSNVSFADVQEAMISVLSHRIKLKPSVQYLKSSEDFIKDELKDYIARKKISIEESSESHEKGGGP